MEKRVFESLEEEIYRTTLSSGLTLMVVPKPEYHKVFGFMTTPFGSIQQWIKNSQTQEKHQIPQGAAHFLEHKLFEDSDGEDVFVQFQAQGASANAFTSRRQTSYLFSSSLNVKENLLTLVDFVQSPSFSKEGVEKEKDIIEQELHMYLDNPYFQMSQTLAECLYPNHPVGHDIGGTVDAVMATTYEDLLKAYETFYAPSQMALVVVGNVDPAQVHQWVKDNQNQKHFDTPDYEEVLEPVVEAPLPGKTMQMEVSQPIVGYGVRLPQLTENGRDLFKVQMVAELLMDLLFGPTSNNYHQWYQKGWVDENFGCMIHVKNPTHDWQFFASTDFADDLCQEIQDVLTHWQDQEDFNLEHFQALKKAHEGDLLQDLNSLEFIATKVTESVFEDYDYFEVLEVLQGIRLEDLSNYADQYLRTDAITRVQINPLEGD